MGTSERWKAGVFKCHSAEPQSKSAPPLWRPRIVRSASRSSPPFDLKSNQYEGSHRLIHGRHSVSAVASLIGLFSIGDNKARFHWLGLAWICNHEISERLRAKNRVGS
ncbi:hypothetical protein EV356DRAFT_70515 [Viridothelium virens]|uniref:Uncharacterized protein n=1 Tax=Viridothelium virens TaxID=1048519 RepID=A0A6A6HE59_VIRVR|nr:hypothetical protein EV356DRAFT_70515 [Viridothelium virens]